MLSVSRTLVALALGGALALAPPAAAAPATVTVANSRFTPSAVTVAAGESVTWDFTEPSHNVKGPGWSGNNGFGRGTFAWTFDVPGTFAYVCEAHPGSMKGTVTVTAAAAPAAPVGDPLAPAGVVDAVTSAVPGASWLLPAAPDLVAPRIVALRVSAGALQLSLSEDAIVVVQLRRDGGGVPASIRRRGRLGPNRIALEQRGLRPGRYRLRIGAVDAAGNESPLRSASVRLQGR